MNPLYIKDTLTYICSFLEEKDQYSLINASKQTRNFFTDRELYERVGWQVLADLGDQKGLTFWKKEKTLQRYDLVNYFYVTDQPSKLVKEDFESIDSAGFDTRISFITGLSYDMIKLEYEYSESFTYEIDNINCVRFAFEHENLKESFHQHFKGNFTSKIEVFRFFCDHFGAKIEDLPTSRNLDTLDFELFLMVEAHLGKEEVQRRLDSSECSHLLLRKDTVMLDYILEKYNITFVHDDVIYYASLRNTSALKVLSTLDLSNSNVSALDWDAMLFDFDLCERVLSTSQMQILIDNFRNTHLCIPEQKGVAYGLKRLYEYKPDEVKSYFLECFPQTLKYEIAAFFNKKYCFQELFLWAVSKGFLEKEMDVSSFFFHLFRDRTQKGLFTFRYMLSILYPKMDLKGITGFQVNESGFVIEKNK